MDLSSKVSSVFLKFSHNYWWLYNKALINQLFVPYGKYSDLSFLYGPHFIRSVLQNCGPNILPYGPHNWLIRVYDDNTFHIENTPSIAMHMLYYIQGVPKRPATFKQEQLMKYWTKMLKCIVKIM